MNLYRIQLNYKESRYDYGVMYVMAESPHLALSIAQATLATQSQYTIDGEPEYIPNGVGIEHIEVN